MRENVGLEREKDKLKKKIAKERRFLIICNVFIPVLCLILDKQFLEDIPFLCLVEFMALVLSLLLYSLGIACWKKDIKFLDACIERNLEDERVTPDIKKEFKLSNEYVEIFLKDEVIINEEEPGSAWTDYNERKLQRDCGGRFFVRLVNDDEAELIVKRADGKIVGKTQRITRFSYLRELFNHEI